MTLDPVRLLDDPESPAEMRADLARTVDLGGVGYGAGAVAVAKSGALVKLIALAGGAAVAVALVFWGIHTRTPAPTTASVVAAPVVTTPVVIETVAPPEPVVVVEATQPVATVVASKPAVRVDVDPHAELAQLTRIRQLVATDPTAALSGVAEGDKTFARGQLQQERAIVAIDALDKLGRHGEAQSHARAFLTAHGDSAYAAHVRSIAEREK